MSKRIFVAVTAAAGLLFGMSSAGLHAQAVDDYPNKPVKIIVPFPAGGTSDIMGRLISDELGKQLKQTFIVDNRAGAGGAIGADQVAKAPADGYTLLLSGIGSKTFKEFIDWVKANPGKFSYGLVPSSSGHLTAEYLKQAAGLGMVGIPYKGSAPALNDALAGQIDGMFVNQDVVLPHLKSGKLRALAVTSAQRNALIPDVPTVAESGYPGFAAVSWTGLSAPKGTPQAVVDKLQAAMAKAFADPVARVRLESNGFVVAVSSSTDYTRFVNQEVDRWALVIRKGGLKAE